MGHGISHGLWLYFTKKSECFENPENKGKIIPECIAIVLNEPWILLSRSSH